MRPLLRLQTSSVRPLSAPGHATDVVHASQLRGVPNRKASLVRERGHPSDSSRRTTLNNRCAVRSTSISCRGLRKLRGLTPAPLSTDNRIVVRERLARFCLEERAKRTVGGRVAELCDGAVPAAMAAGVGPLANWRGLAVERGHEAG